MSRNNQLLQSDILELFGVIAITARSVGDTITTDEGLRIILHVVKDLMHLVNESKPIPYNLILKAIQELRVTDTKQKRSKNERKRT